MMRGRLFLFSAFLGVIFLFTPFSVVGAAANDVVITEIMFDPAGADTKHEWVELKNIGSDPVEVIGGSGNGGWRFFSGSNHTFSTSTRLSGGEYLVIVQDEAVFLSDHPGFIGKTVKSSFSLNNSSSTLALRFGSAGAKWTEIAYDSAWGGAGNGKSLEKKNLTGDNAGGNWQESAVDNGTPGVNNSEKANNKVIVLPEIVVNEAVPAVVFAGEKSTETNTVVNQIAASAVTTTPIVMPAPIIAPTVVFATSAPATTTGMAESTVQPVAIQNISGAETQKEETVVFADFKTVPLEQIRFQAVGQKVRTNGRVSVLPSVFSTQMFYLSDSKNLTGAGIYMYKKDFPSLRVGEMVEVIGELGTYQNALRLKTKERGDIQKIKGPLADTARLVKSTDLSKNALNALVELSGEVVEVAGSDFVLADDHGEVVIQIKKGSGLKSGAVKEGDLVKLIGLVGWSKNAPAIWPRQLTDLVITGLGAGINREEKITSAASVASSSATTDKAAKGYLTATAGGLTGFLLALLARSRSAMIKGVAVGLLAKTAFWKRDKKKDSL